jgi:hypothetical protein
MEKVEFLLFIHKPKDHIDRGLLFFTLFAIGFTMLWLGGDEYFSYEALRIIGGVVLGCTGIGYLFFSFYSFSEKERLNGSFNGKLVYSKSSVSIGIIEYLLNDISKIEIFVGDYNGMKHNYLGYSVIPKVSNGVGNSLKLTMKDGSEKTFNFQLNYENEIQEKMRDILISYHLQDKISFLALIQYIGISDDYEQIQEFKKELIEVKT